MAKRTALVTNATSDSGLTVIRALARSGYEVHGTDFRRLPLGARSHYVKVHHTLPNESVAGFETALLDLLDRLRPDVFLPIGTTATLAAIKNADRVASLSRVNLPDVDAFYAAHNKVTSMVELEQLSIAVPQSYSESRACALLARAGEPDTLVVKPAANVGAAKGVRYVRNVELLEEATRDCKERYGTVLIQDYIPGGPEAMKTVVVVFSRDSDLVAAFTAKKIRQWPATGGATVVSTSTAEEELVDLVLPFFRKWRWRGPAEVELKYDARDGLHKVIEINPRFPGYIRFLRHCGLDVARLSADLAVGSEHVTPRPFPDYAVGKRYISPGVFLRAVQSELRGENRIAALGKAIRDLRGTTRLVLGMLADPVPMIARFARDARAGPAPLCPRAFSRELGGRG